jgi:hypothetical protein
MLSQNSSPSGKTLKGLKYSVGQHEKERHSQDVTHLRENPDCIPHVKSLLQAPDYGSREQVVFDNAVDIFSKEPQFPKEDTLDPNVYASLAMTQAESKRTYYYVAAISQRPDCIPHMKSLLQAPGHGSREQAVFDNAVDIFSKGPQHLLRPDQLFGHDEEARGTHDSRASDAGRRRSDWTLMPPPPRPTGLSDTFGLGDVLQSAIPPLHSRRTTRDSRQERDASPPGTGKAPDPRYHPNLGRGAGSSRGGFGRQ